MVVDSLTVVANSINELVHHFDTPPMGAIDYPPPAHLAYNPPPPPPERAFGDTHSLPHDAF